MISRTIYCARARPQNVRPLGGRFVRPDSRRLVVHGPAKSHTATIACRSRQAVRERVINWAFGHYSRRAATTPAPENHGKSPARQRRSHRPNRSLTRSKIACRHPRQSQFLAPPRRRRPRAAVRTDRVSLLHIVLERTTPSLADPTARELGFVAPAFNHLRAAVEPPARVRPNPSRSRQ